MFRTGLGFDSHRLTPGRKLLLGGVEIPAPVGAEAHSDGDVVLHAFCDALYGALGSGDIGEHFPDSDPRWKGQSSSLFLEHALGLVRDGGYRLVNVDATIFLERVKVSPHRRRITESILRSLRSFWDLPDDAVNVKAKTAERCDAVGRGEAVAAQAIVLLERVTS
jgi:2-C-methyl-D-erythritol 2,4-cyclodiphosphate synthase